ncbi:hypothetical protein [Candidatus Borrelia fainii]|nr:hypothetical protein [Candidatus Borrelia fainii]
MEDKYLSESLFLFDEDYFIDSKYFKVVTHILSVVYKLKSEKL